MTDLLTTGVDVAAVVYAVALAARQFLAYRIRTGTPLVSDVG